MYGRGEDDLHASFPQYTKEECRGWIEGWAKTYPDAWAYLQSCEDAIKRGEALTTVYGRYKRVGLVTQQNLKSLSNESKNFRIQSISSDNTMTAAMDAEQELLKYDAHIVNLIHDSILIDCPGDPETTKAVASLMVNTMEGLPKRLYDCDMKFHCDVDLGPNWGDNGAYDIETETIKWKGEKISYKEFFETVIKS